MLTQTVSKPSVMGLSRGLLLTGLLAAAPQLTASCVGDDLNGSWDMFFGTGAIPGTQCQLKVSNNKKLTGQCRLLEAGQGFGDWIKISKGRLKVTSNCAVSGRFTITSTGDFLFTDAPAQVELPSGRMHDDGQAINGILYWLDPASAGSTPVYHHGVFSAVNR